MNKKTRDTNLNPNDIKVFALGGLGEIGKNMYIVEQNDELIIIDSGLIFPDHNYGVNVLIPNYQYLKENESKIKGLFITHGHEDHIGGIPYLLSQVNIPAIYANGIALGLIKQKFSEFKNLHPNLIEFSADSSYKFTNFTISFFRTNHSIPDSFGIAIKTKLGYILHTGDFKFDFTPIGEGADYHKITSYGNEGVLLLLSDSTNAIVTKPTLSEAKIGESIDDMFSNIKGRIIIVTFASNVYRVKQIIDASIHNNRKVIVFGRSMEKTLNVSRELKYIKAPQDTFISIKDFPHLPLNKITIMSTGSQGEPLAALTRIANGTHKQIKIIEGDTIIFSSSAIPGNQESINRLINSLYKQGANVIVNTSLTDTHTSGHASATELQLMIDLCKPKYFMPIHGEYAMLKKHSDLAIDAGVDRKNAFILKNGEVLSFNEKGATKKGYVQSGYSSIGTNNTFIDRKIVDERRSLSENGIVSLIYTIRGSILIDKPKFESRGFIYMKDSLTLIKDIQTKAYKVANTYLIKNTRLSDTKFKQEMELKIKEYIKEITGLTPSIVISLIKVEK